MIVKRKVEPSFTDARGVITNVLDEPLNSVVHITSATGAIRGNHFHREETHWSYIVTGSMEYLELPAAQAGEPERTIVKAGEMVFSPAGHPHAMRFLEPSTFLALTSRRRTGGRYDEDTVTHRIL